MMRQAMLTGVPTISLARTTLVTPSAPFLQAGGKEKYYNGTLDAWRKIIRDEGRKVNCTPRLSLHCDGLPL